MSGALLLLGMAPAPSAGAAAPPDLSARSAAKGHPSVAAAPLTPTDNPAAARWAAHTDGMLITVDPDQDPAAAASRAGELLGVGVEVGRQLPGDTVLLTLRDEVEGVHVEDAAAQLAAEGRVRTADPDVRLLPAAAPNDPAYPQQWNLHGRRGGSDARGIGVEQAWEHTTGSADVIVAVLDTGIVSHPDLNSRIIDGYSFVEGRPDPTDRGIDCEQVPGVPIPHEARWHGLHVAGIVGAATDNGVGIAGVDHRARIRPVRVISDCGGTVSDLIGGILWSSGLAVDDLPAPTQADVINLSLGGVAARCPAPLRAAIQTAVDRGTIVVAAVGNDNVRLEEQAFIPASCPGTIAVSATSPAGDRAGKRAAGGGREPYANHGTRVDISAPGGDNAFDGGAILSLAPGAGYGAKSGTSMAAPQVSGVAALLRARDPSITPEQVRRLLMDTAQPFAFDTPGAQWRCGGRVIRCGAGILDAGAALAATPTPRLRFADAAGTHSEAIAWMTDYGITRGCDSSGRRFCTHEPVTRAQTASFLARALHLTSGRDASFTDVPPGSTHADAIDALRREQITDGCSSSGPRFCPADQITRQEVASLIARAEQFPRRSTSFRDVADDNRHAGAIGALYQRDITRGCDEQGTRFCPTRPVTRGQLASMLHRALT